MSMLVLACITPFAFVAVFGVIAFFEERGLERERLAEEAAKDLAATQQQESEGLRPRLAPAYGGPGGDDMEISPPPAPSIPAAPARRGG